MIARFKSNLTLTLVKAFSFSLFIILAIRLFESQYMGYVFISKYYVVILWPVVISLFTWYSERSSLKEIEISDDGIRVTNHKGESFKMLWKAVSTAKYKARKRILSRSIWALRDKDGTEILIPGGILSYKDEDKMNDLIRAYLSKDYAGGMT